MENCCFSTLRFWVDYEEVSHSNAKYPPIISIIKTTLGFLYIGEESGASSDWEILDYSQFMDYGKNII